MSLMCSWLCNSSCKKVENLMAIVVTALIVAFASVIWFTWNAKKKKSSKASTAPLPPAGPRGFPLIGYLPFLGTDLHKSLTNLAGVYGPIYRLWLGNKLCVVVSSPSLANEVVRDKDIIFANRDPPIAALVSTYGGKDITTASYGPDLRKLRKIMVTEMMSNASLDDCYILRKQAVKNAIRDLYNNKIGKPIDIGELSFSTSFNLVQNMLLGGTLGLGEKETTELKNVLAELLVLIGKPNISDVFPVLSRFDLQGIERRTKKIFHRFDQIINSAIEHHRNADNKKRDILQFLLQLTESEEDTATSITMTQLKALLVNIITGGTETSANTVEWTMTELMQHPEEMKKVQEELVQVVGMDNSVEESHLPKLKYLAAILKETLRLHPPLPELGPRCPSQTTTIGGYTIPKDTMVMLNVWAIHRDPQLWDSPMEFRPERFLDDPSKFDYSGNNFRYMPFSSGRRICPGVPLAERMLMFVLASLLHSFDWKLPCGEKLDFSDQFGFVMKKLKPLVAIPTPRLANEELY